jgi:hypothetical protein
MSNNVCKSIDSMTLNEKPVANPEEKSSSIDDEAYDMLAAQHLTRKPDKMDTKRKYLRRLSTGSFFFTRSEIKETECKLDSPAPCQNDKSQANPKPSFFGMSTSQKKLNKTKKASFDATMFTEYDGKHAAQRRSSNASYVLGDFEVDLAKLTRELTLPTVDKPLTSFKPMPNTSSAEPSTAQDKINS